MGTAEGGFLCLAIKRLPLKGKPKFLAREAKTVDINMALVIRVGNFKTPVYLEIGAKPGCSVRKKGSKKARLAAGLFA